MDYIVAVIGDVGATHNSKNTVQSILKFPEYPNITIHVSRSNDLKIIAYFS